MQVAIFSFAYIHDSLLFLDLVNQSFVFLAFYELRKFSSLLDRLYRLLEVSSVRINFDIQVLCGHCNCLYFYHEIVKHFLLVLLELAQVLEFLLFKFKLFGGL